ncbi:MAG: OmpA family protein [Flavobacteriaceae bacterium]
MKNIFVKIFIAFLIVKLSIAQTPENPWSFSVGANITNLLEKEIDSEIGFGGPAISFTRYIGLGLSIGTQYSLGVSSINDVNLDYTSFDGIIKLNLGKNKFIPYLFSGYGLTNFSNNNKDKGLFPSMESSRTILAGIGFDITVSEKLKLNISSSYRSNNESGTYNHLQNVFGLRYNFGLGDRDKDGISDKKDECPDLPGLKEFNGCPDTDNDGLPDNKDDCPEEAGPEKTKGCPDNDEDGISNNDDKCPDDFGLLENDGCPDIDNDGVINIEDKCPNEYGEIDNQGCPLKDKDNDGVLDNDDLCPDVPGSKKNNGCPTDVKVKNEIIKTLNSFGENINFIAESFDIIGQKTINVLVEIKNLLIKNSKINLYIEGYSSSDGSDNYNLMLSRKRAESVKSYLVKLGVDENRLEVVGYGESNPIGDNDNPMGRSMNRRVQFKMKN